MQELSPYPVQLPPPVAESPAPPPPPSGVREVKLLGSVEVISVVEGGRRVNRVLVDGEDWSSRVSCIEVSMRGVGRPLMTLTFPVETLSGDFDYVERARS